MFQQMLSIIHKTVNDSHYRYNLNKDTKPLDCTQSRIKSSISQMKGQFSTLDTEMTYPIRRKPKQIFLFTNTYGNHLRTFTVVWHGEAVHHVYKDTIKTSYGNMHFPPWDQHKPQISTVGMDIWQSLSELSPSSLLIGRISHPINFKLVENRSRMGQDNDDGDSLGKNLAWPCCNFPFRELGALTQ